MSYITTFDAAFWTSVIMAVAMYSYQYFFSDHCVRMVLKLIKKYSLIKLNIAYAAITILGMIGFFYWSVKGTTTSIFWGFVLMAVFYPVIRKFSIALMERNYASFEKINL